MAEYSGSIDLISGIRPKNNGTFPLVDAKDVQVDDSGTRLDAAFVQALQVINNLAVTTGNLTPIIMTESEYEAAVAAGTIDESRTYYVTGDADE